MAVLRQKKTMQVAMVTAFGVGTRLISFLFKIYLSRTLGAETLGLYQIALSVFFLFASLTSSGIPLVLSRKVAEEQALQKNRTDSLFTTAFLLSISIAISEIAIIFILKDKISFLFSDKNALPVFFIMLPALLSTAVYAVVRGWFWGKKNFSVFSFTETAEEILRILFSVFFLSGCVWKLSGIQSISYAFTLCDIVIALTLMVLFFRKGGKFSRPCPLKNVLTPALPITSMHLLSGLFGTLLTVILPAQLLVYGMSSLEATASIGRISGMANPLLFAPNAFTGSIAVVMMPDSSGLYIRKDFSALQKRLDSGIHFSLLVTGLFMAFFVASGEVLTSFLYHDVESGFYLRIAAYFMLPMCLSQLTQNVLNSVGKEKSTFLSYLIGNAFMILTVFLLTPSIGIYSVAVGHFISLCFIAVYNSICLHRCTGWGNTTLKYLFYALVFSSAVAFLGRFLLSITSDISDLIRLLIVGFAVTLCYGSLCILSGLLDIRVFFSFKKPKKTVKKKIS